MAEEAFLVTGAKKRYNIFTGGFNSQNILFDLFSFVQKVHEYQVIGINLNANQSLCALERR